MHSPITSTKTQKEITQEIQAIQRQITASVTFLPLLNEPCSFDLLVYVLPCVTLSLIYSFPSQTHTFDYIPFRSKHTHLIIFRPKHTHFNIFMSQTTSFVSFIRPKLILFSHFCLKSSFPIQVRRQGRYSTNHVGRLRPVLYKQLRASQAAIFQHSGMNSFFFSY